MDSLSFLLGRRIWAVRDFSVWGLTESAHVNYLTVHDDEETPRLYFGTAGIGGEVQEVAFADLTDIRGNHLPDAIPNARVIISPRSQYPAFLTGTGSNLGFQIARDPDAPGPVTVDLIVMEMP